MTELMRVRVAWSGWPGGPGVSTHFVSGTDIAPALAALNTFYDYVKTATAGGITITVPAEGDIIEDSTGALTGQWQHGTETKHQAATGATYMAAAGALVQWNTSTIHGRRRLKGHTFIVPTATGYFDATGQVLPANAAQLQTAAGNCISAASNTLVVWGRPGQDPTKPNYKTGGMHGEITTATVPLRGTVLRSRRG